MNSKGVTLIELLIYIALLAVVSLIIGKQFSALANNYAAGKQVAKQQVASRDILGLLVREIRNTGVKLHLHADYTLDTATGTWVSSTDKSSFIHTDALTPSCDSLTVFMARLNSTGTNTGDSAGVDTLAYYVTNNELWRRQNSTVNYRTNSIVAKNVYALQFQFGINRRSVTPITPVAFDNAKWDNGAQGGASYLNPVFTFPATASRCSLMTKAAATYNVAANTKYKFRVRLDPSVAYAANLSYAQVGFCNGATILGSENFLPRSTDTMDIFVPISEPSTAARAFLKFSATGTGPITIVCLGIPSVELSTFSWVNKFPSPDSTTFKADVRAIKILVLTRTTQKAGTRETAPIPMANISFTPYGDYTWRLYSEIVDIRNNGVF